MFHYKHIIHEPEVHKELLDKEKGEPLVPFMTPDPVPESPKPKKKNAKVQKTSQSS